MFLFYIFLFFVTITRGALVNFTGGLSLSGSYDISNSLLWGSQSSPSIGDDVVINACVGSSCPSLNINFPSGSQYKSLVVSGTSITLSGTLTISSSFNFSGNATSNFHLQISPSAQSNFYSSSSSFISFTNSNFSIQGSATFSGSDYRISNFKLTVANGAYVDFKNVNSFYSPERYTPVDRNVITNLGIIAIDHASSGTTNIVANISNSGSIILSSCTFLFGANDDYGQATIPSLDSPGAINFVHNASFLFGYAGNSYLYSTSSFVGTGVISSIYTSDILSDAIHFISATSNSVVNFGVNFIANSNIKLQGPGAFNFAYLDTSRGVQIETAVTVQTLIDGPNRGGFGTDWTGQIIISNNLVSSLFIISSAVVGKSDIVNQRMLVGGNVTIGPLAEFCVSGGDYNMFTNGGNAIVNNYGILRAYQGNKFTVENIPVNNYGSIYSNTTGSSVNLLGGGKQDGIIYTAITNVSGSHDTTVQGASVVLGGPWTFLSHANVSYDGFISNKGAACGELVGDCIAQGSLQINSDLSLLGIINSKIGRIVIVNSTAKTDSLFVYGGGQLVGSSGNLIARDVVFDSASEDDSPVVSITNINLQITNSAIFYDAYPLYDNGSITFGPRSTATFMQNNINDQTEVNEFAIFNYGTVILNMQSVKWNSGIRNYGNIRFGSFEPVENTEGNATRGGSLEFNTAFSNEGTLSFQVYNTTDFDQVLIRPGTSNCSISGSVALNFQFSPETNSRFPIVKYQHGDGVTNCTGSFSISTITGLAAGQALNFVYDVSGTDSRAPLEVHAVVCSSSNSSCLASVPAGGQSGSTTASSSTGSSASSGSTSSTPTSDSSSSSSPSSPSSDASFIGVPIFSLYFVVISFFVLLM